MEELADAIGDASFVAAISSLPLKPTLKLTLPSAGEVRARISEVNCNFEAVIQEPLGLHFFYQFLKQAGRAETLDFVADVALFSVTRASPSIRLQRATEIVSKYFRRRSGALALEGIGSEAAAVSAPLVSTSEPFPKHTSSDAPVPTATSFPASSPANETVATAAAAGFPSSIVTPQLDPAGSGRSSFVYDTATMEATVSTRDRRAHARSSSSIATLASPRSITSASWWKRASASVAPMPSIAAPPKRSEEAVRLAVVFRPGASGSGRSAISAAVAVREQPSRLLAIAAAFKRNVDMNAVILVYGVYTASVEAVVAAHCQSLTDLGGDTAYDRYFQQTFTTESALTPPTALALAPSRTLHPAQRSPVDSTDAAAAVGETHPQPFIEAGSAVVDAARRLSSGPPSPTYNSFGARSTAMRRSVIGADSTLQTGLDPALFTEIRDIVLEALRFVHWQTYTDSAFFTEYLQFKALERQHAHVNDFLYYRVLGRGGFGVVSGCKHKTTGKLFAAKVMSKARIKAKNAVDLVWAERTVLNKVNSPFVIGLHYCFQTASELFLVTDLATGGDLAFHLSREIRFRPERVQFYAAQVLLALEHLHSMGIVYRDLKPENVLLTESGDCMLSDLGLATQVTPTLSGLSTDYWSFGCVVYEMLCGKCPFRTELARSLDPDKHVSMDKATLHMIVPYDDRYFDADAKDLISRLLVRDPTKRLINPSEIKAHPFFGAIDFGLLHAGLVASPWLPELSINAPAPDLVGAFDEALGQPMHSEEHYVGWEATNAFSFQQEVAEHLLSKLAADAVEVSSAGPGCCAVM